MARSADAPSTGERYGLPSPPSRLPDRLPPRIYAVMALTSLSTFAVLKTGYELFFARQIFA